MRTRKRPILPNRIGQKYGEWEVLGGPIISNLKNSPQVWICRCSCGKEQEVRENFLKNGLSTKCVDCKTTKYTVFNNLIGQKIGSWTPLSFGKSVKTARGNAKTLLCRCECGYELVIWGTRLKNGKYPKCCKCRPKIQASVAYKRFWRSLNWMADTRGLKITVSLEEIFALLEKQNNKCALTGLNIMFPHTKNSSDRTASLDRIDSNKDYSIDNIQWIHKDINKMKNNFSEDKLLEYCKLIVKHLEGK
jgi:hypothetical protein